MGNCVSDEQMRREQEHIENVQLHNRAVALYQYREKQYNFYIHGSYVHYMRQIAHQFELDCLPDDCKYGSNARF